MIATIEAVSSKDVNTKFGTKPVYSFKASGEWYKCGFKRPMIDSGDVVEFDFKVSTYGNEVVDGTLKKSSGAAAAQQPARVASIAPSYSGSKGAFPIPLLDGQRSIIRQNSLTNARELWTAAMGPKGFPFDSTMIDAIIDTARKFEAYSAGDLDTIAAKASIASDKAAA